MVRAATMLATLATLLIASPVFGAQEPLILGVTDLGQAIAEMHAQQIPIRHVIPRPTT